MTGGCQKKGRAWKDAEAQAEISNEAKGGVNAVTDYKARDSGSEGIVYREATS